MRRLLAELGESIRMALSAIGTHKLRSGLTLLGVLVGVFSIILVMTAMRAMQNNIESELGQMGSKTFVVKRMPLSFFGGREGFMKFLRRRPIDHPQARSFHRRATFAAAVGLQTNFSSATLVSPYATTPPDVRLTGANSAVAIVSNWTISEGRSLLESDLESARDVCLLSSDLALTLFPLGSPVGQRVKIASINYTVVGIFTRGSADEESSSLAVIPLTTGLNRFGRWREIEIMVQAESPETFEDTMEQARGLMRAIRKVAPGEPDDFELLSSDAMIQQFQQVTLAVRTGLSLVSSIALLAAGVGIMNIMLVSVTERTREIGIRRALGAKKRNIMTQFVVEAVVLCQIGGLLGIAFGLVGANALAVYVLKLPPALPLDWAVFGLVICSVIGVVFGSYPAYKAANLDPIESLRYE